MRISLLYWASVVTSFCFGAFGATFRIVREDPGWGYAQWIKPLISLILDGVSGIADYQCRQMLRDRYHRLAPVFPPDVSIPMDDVKKIPYMIQFAEGHDLRKTISWMRQHWMES